VDRKAEENLKSVKVVMEQLFAQINAAAKVGFGSRPRDFILRKVSAEVGKLVSQTREEEEQSLFKTVNASLQSQNVKVVFQQTACSDHLATPSLKKFILKFGERTMHIYDAILSEKRILFNGGLEYSAEEI